MNLKMKATGFLWLVLCLAQTLMAQNGVVASGGDLVASGGSVSYSVGQIAFAAISSETGSVNPGLQQPYRSSVVAVDQFLRDVSLKIYPNPASQYLFLQLSSGEAVMQGQEYIARMHDNAGRLILQQNLLDQVNIVKLNGLPDGLYFIQIWQYNTLIQSFSFSKIN